MRNKKIHLAVFLCLFQLSTASYADRHGHEQDDDHDGYEQDECRSSRGSCNTLSSAQSSYSSSSRSGSGYESNSREGCSEDGDDSHGSNHQESDHNSTCAAPVQTSAALTTASLSSDAFGCPLSSPPLKPPSGGFFLLRTSRVLATGLEESPNHSG